MREHATPILIFLVLVALVGCNDQRYLNDGQTFAVAIDENTAPFVSAEDNAVFWAETRVDVPVWDPGRSTLRTLRMNRVEPFPRAPWVRRGDMGIEVDWLIRNLADQRQEVTLTVNGYNEFHEYMPDFLVEDDEVVFGFSQFERTYVLEAFETLEGTIREEQMDEVATDLATVVNGAPNANQIVYWENQSATDERSQQYIPAVVPGLLGFRLGMQAAGSPRLIAEATVRVRDINDKLGNPEEEPDEVWSPPPTPELFTPVMMEP